MINHKFYKLSIIEKFLAKSSNVRHQLLEELVTTATNDIKFMRRVRMLEQLSTFESQIIKKIYNLKTNDIDDYNTGFQHIMSELAAVSSRNA
jgi:hypothetical protein